MSNREPAALARLQAPSASMLPDGARTTTSPLLPDLPVRERLRHFDEQVFSLSPESSVTKFLSSMLGQSGVGGLRKKLLIARMGQTLHGSHFYDLDRFYGALFGLRRSEAERYDIDPTRDVGTVAEWQTARLKDASYRSRISQLAQAINHGPTALGMRLAAEALLNSECDIHEVWRYLDDPTAHASDLSAMGTRREFVIRPHRGLTEEERFNLITVLRRLKPANSLLTVDKVGITSYTEVPLRGIYADSENWEVITKVTDIRIGTQTPYGTGSGELVELRRPPLSGYQGEAWSYHADILSVRSYTDTQPDRDNFQQVTYPNGTMISYRADESLFSNQKLLSGRLASDGISVIHPYAPNTQGDTSQAVSDLYLDHIGVNVLDSLLRSTGRAGIPRDSSFWSTPERVQNDPTIEYLEVRLSEVKLLNKVSFDVSRFPHVSTIEVYNEQTGMWDPELSRRVQDSVPSRFVSRNLSDDIHPQHHGPSHWTRVSMSFPATYSSRVRIALRRGEGTPPLDTDNEALTYSLALRHVEIGYRVHRIQDVPAQPVDQGESVITTSVDRLGSRIQFVFRKDRANVLLEDNDDIWMSEPQPTSDAVVNLYVDTRDEDGDAPTLERIYIEPVVEGPTATLYTSDDEPGTIFKASDLPLNPLDTGTIGWDFDSLVFDTAAAAYLDISNLKVQFDPTRSWWMGFDLRAGFSSSDVASHPLIDLGGLTLSFEADELVLQTPGGSVSLPTDHNAGSRLYIIAAYNPDDRIATLLMRRGDNAWYWHSEHLNADIARPSTIRFGGSFADPTLISGMALRTFVLKDTPLDPLYAYKDTTYKDLEEGAFTAPTYIGLEGFTYEELKQYIVNLRPDEVEAFFANSTSFVNHPDFEHERTDWTGNTLIRLNQSFITDTAPFGMLGGPGNYFEAMTWSLVPHKYKLSRGFLHLPPTRAKAIKFEFTNLVVEPYESFLTIERRTNVHPKDAREHYERSIDQRIDDEPQLEQAIRNLSRFLGEDRAQKSDEVALWLLEEFRVTPTELMVALDHEAAARLRERSWIHGWKNHHIASESPRFIKDSQHIYERRHISHRDKVAYSVGLRRLIPYNIDFNSEADTQVYFNNFTTSNASLTLDRWIENDGGIIADSPVALVESSIYQSHTDVEAVQFAVQQTQAKQVMPNHTFSDSDTAIGSFQDSSKWHEFGDAFISYRETNKSILVQRANRRRTYGDVEAFGTYGDVEAQGRYGDLESVSSGGNTGGVESPPIYPSLGADITVVVRVMGLMDLDAPLILQAIDQDGNIVASKRKFVLQGEIAEWWATYSVGAAIEFNTYGDLESPDPVIGDGTYGGLEAFTYRNISRVADTSPDNLTFRVVQEGFGDNRFEVMKFSVYDNPISWEFSVDGGTNWTRAISVANNPRGVMRFREPGRQLKWRARGTEVGVSISALQIRPWYVGRPQDPEMPREGHGPNLSLFEQHAPIDSDVMFKQWSLPVPERWFADR